MRWFRVNLGREDGWLDKARESWVKRNCSKMSRRVNHEERINCLIDHMADLLRTWRFLRKEKKKV